MLLAPGNPNHGKALFRDNGCAICHGVDASGGDSGPDLRDADLIESASNLQLSQTTLEASLTLNARVFDLTILNFI